MSHLIQTYDAQDKLLGGEKIPGWWVGLQIRAIAVGVVHFGDVGKQRLSIMDVQDLDCIGTPQLDEMREDDLIKLKRGRESGGEEMPQPS